MQSPLSAPGTSQSGRRRVLALFLAAVAFAMTAALPGYADVVIQPLYDSSITNDPNGATIEDTIAQAISVYKTVFSDPITVAITFREDVTISLGASSTFFNVVPYAVYLSALTADAKTNNDAIALAHLPPGPNNPVTGDPNMSVTTANLRAVGLPYNPPSGQSDSTISLNTSIMNLSRSSIDPNKYDLMSVVFHEIDEALGFGSSLNGKKNGDPSPTTSVFPEDLFRYDQNGARSSTTDINAQAFFSIDGTTDLVQFNQDARGDFSDWSSSGTPRVQDAFATPGATPNLGVELTALDVIGYDFKLPEPGTAVLVIAGLLAIAVRRMSRANS